MNHHGQISKRVIVVGGGIAGLSIALRLAEAGLPVTLLEASRLGHGASTRYPGWLHSGAWFAPEDEDVARGCYQSLEYTCRLCPDCLESEHEGMAFLFSDPDTSATRWVEAWDRAEIPWRELPLEQSFRQVPGLAENQVQQAFLLPDRSMRAELLLQCLAATAEKQGAEIRTETAVVKVQWRGSRVRSVITGTGEKIPARFVVLAGGAEGMALRSEVTHEEAGRQSDYTLVPLKTHLVAVQPQISHLPFCVVDAEGFHHIPRTPASLFGAHRWSVVSNPTDQHVEPSEIDRLWEHVARFFPQLNREEYEVLQLAGTTIQAMHVEQVEPGQAPLPTIIDHCDETPKLENILSVFPGRASLWPQLADDAARLVFEKLEHRPAHTPASP